MCYALTNAVKDGQVRDYRKWPGVCSRPRDWRQPVRYAERPDYFIDQKDADWASVPWQLTVPPMLRDRPLDRLIEDAETLIRDEQQALLRTNAAQGIGVRGVKAVLRTDPFDSPNKPRPKGKTNPTVAAGGDTAMLQEGIRLVRNFRERFREAWKAYRAGQREVLFPSGTLLMRTLHGVACDSLQAPWCAAPLVPT
jgi:hypothetical protein